MRIVIIVFIVLVEAVIGQVYVALLDVFALSVLFWCKSDQTLFVDEGCQRLDHRRNQNVDPEIKLVVIV